MLVMLLSLIGSLLGVIGWFVKKSVVLLLVGFALTLVEMVTEWKNYNSGAKSLNIVLFIIGSIIGKFAHIPFWAGGLLALLIYDLIISIFGVAMLIIGGTNIGRRK